jgi:hypothetical protein
MKKKGNQKNEQSSTSLHISLAPENSKTQAHKDILFLKKIEPIVLSMLRQANKIV